MNSWIDSNNLVILCVLISRCFNQDLLNFWGSLTKPQSNRKLESYFCKCYVYLNNRLTAAKYIDYSESVYKIFPLLI